MSSVSRRAGSRSLNSPVTLDVNSKLDVGQIKLEVGNVTEAVSVDAATTPLVTSNTMEKAFLVDRTQIAELPMNGRNWVSLMSTIPGMSSSARNDFDVNFNDVSQFHGLGGRGSQNNFYLDGSPNLDVGDNQSQYTQPSIDSIAEFRVLQSSFNAEYGRNEGMAVAVQTKSGAARFHGTAYEYLRNDAFDAKCVLCNTLSPKLRYNQFGGNFSGWVPVPKLSTRQEKKLFFFYNREMTRRVLPSSAYADIPNAKIMSGDFSPFLLNTNMTYAPQFKTGTVFQPGTIKRDGAGNIIDGLPFAGNVVPQSLWQPLSANMLKIYTGIPGYANLPAAPNPGYVRYFYNNPSRLWKNQDLLRVDYAIRSKMNTFFRWVNDYQKEQNENGIWTGEPFPIQPQMRPKPGSSWSWNLVTTFTPSAGGRDHPVLQPPVAVAVDRRRQSAGPQQARRRVHAALSECQPDQLHSRRAGVSHQLGPWQSGMAQRRQGLRLHRKRLVYQAVALFQIRLLLQSGRQEADRHLADDAEHQFQFLGGDAFGHRQRAGQPDAGQFPEPQPEQRGHLSVLPFPGL